MSTPDPYTDVVELCALLQCLGFSVKSLDTHNSNVSQEEGLRTVVINCQASGIRVVMESSNILCSCPAACQQENSGFWQVSGVTGGKQSDKEYGSTLLGCLPKDYRERLTKDLLEIVRNIKEYNESDMEKSNERESITNRSASMLELKTPDRRMMQLPSETPTRYRSLDTLTAVNTPDQNLPAPGPLQKHHIDDKSSMDINNQDKSKLMPQRQSTYTLSLTPECMRSRNKTSSPIQGADNKLLESLKATVTAAEDLRNKLASIVRDYRTSNVDEIHESSLNSLVLDVSKISVLKGTETSKFVSSPNLSALGGNGDDSRSRLKRTDSASTSNLAPRLASKDNKIASKLRRLSPNMFKLKKGNQSPTVYKVEKAMSQENKSSKLNTLYKPKVAPPNIPKVTVEDSPNLSASRKKFSHVKSTIPRPSAKKE